MGTHRIPLFRPPPSLWKGKKKGKGKDDRREKEKEMREGGEKVQKKERKGRRREIGIGRKIR